MQFINPAKVCKGMEMGDVPPSREILKTTSKDMGDEGYDMSYGWGVIDFPAFAKEVTK